MHLDQDLLQQKNTFPRFPRLSALAHVMLAVSATSAPPEYFPLLAWFNGTAGREIKILAPNKVNKVVFVHNNVHL